MPRCCSCVDCVCKYSNWPFKTGKKPTSNTDSQTYSNVYSKSDQSSIVKNAAATSVKPIPSYPYSMSIKPSSTYYDEATATYSDESSNLYYKLTDFEGKIKNPLLRSLEYTKNREYFEKVEKLRFRLPTAQQLELQPDIPAVALEARIKSVQRIREKYPDECVAPTETSSAGSHVCSHRFQLNERRFPEPSLTDEDGNSLCSTCYTPSMYMMENNVTPLNCVKRFTIPRRLDEQETSSTAKRSEDSPILVLEAPHTDPQAGFFGKSRGGKGTYPFPNSLALSHQRRKY